MTKTEPTMTRAQWEAQSQPQRPPMPPPTYAYPPQPYGSPVGFVPVAPVVAPKKKRHPVLAVVLLAILASLIIALATGGSGSSSPAAPPPPPTAPSTIGDTLPDAEATLTAAKFAYVEHPLGEHLFGIVQPENWIVCDQVKLAGRKIRLDASNDGCPS